MRLDCHVHLLGDGTSGSGCWLKMGWYQKCLAAVMLRQLGIPPRALGRNLDAAYVERLRELVYFSSLDAIVLLANDYAHDAQGRPLRGFGAMYTPNDYLIDVCDREPCFLPGISLHPARPDAIDELHRLAAGGAVVLKLLPNCHNVDCRDDKYIPFWEALAKLQIVFLAHTGGELSLPVYNPRYSDPRYLEGPLACGATVIAAHCGTSSLLWDADYVEVFGEMLDRFPRLYGDNSGMMTPIRVRHMRKLLEEPYRSRMIHGSDIPIPISARWAYWWRFISRRNYDECEHEENMLQRDVLLKTALGFGEKSYTRLHSLLRPNALMKFSI